MVFFRRKEMSDQQLAAKGYSASNSMYSMYSTNQNGGHINIRDVWLWAFVKCGWQSICDRNQPSIRH